MKKLLFTTVAILMLGIFNQASAQFGVRAGLNIAGLSGEDAEDIDNKMGIHAGLFYEHMLSEALYLRPGALLSFKGAKAEDEFGGVTFSNSINLSYIEVPIDLVYKIPVGANSFNINAGPYVGLLMGATSKFDDGTTSESEDVKENVKGLDFGLNIGAEFQLNAIGIGAGYGLGLANIDNTEGDDATIKNKNLTLYLAYRF